MDEDKKTRRWRLGEILIQNGWVSWEHLKKALEIQRQLRSGARDIYLKKGVDPKQKVQGLNLGEILVRNGWIAWDQLEEALEIQAETKQILGKICLEQGFVAEKDLYRALALQYDLPFVDFKKISVLPDAVKLIPKLLAYEYQVMPVMKKLRSVLLATADPKDLKLDEEMRRFLPTYEIHYAIACPSDIAEAIKQYYFSDASDSASPGSPAA